MYLKSPLNYSVVTESDPHQLQQRPVVKTNTIYKVPQSVLQEKIKKYTAEAAVPGNWHQKVGDVVLGYDLRRLNLSGMSDFELLGSSMPEVVLVRKGRLVKPKKGPAPGKGCDLAGTARLLPFSLFVSLLS